MNLIEEKLILLESQLQVFVEGTAERLFAGKPLSVILAHRLMNAVNDGLHVLPDGRLEAPAHLAIFVCPAEIDLFRNQRWLRDVEGALRSIGAEQGIHFPERAFIKVEPGDQLAPGELLVAAGDEVRSISQTNDIAMVSADPENYPPGVFLIIDGTRIIPLEHPVFNLGRRPDNHLVIDDSRVSRTHAQLRLVRGQFVIFDLDLSGGTFVNGNRILQQVLQPGDVISLAGVPIVYGQDTAGLGETQELDLL